MDYSSSSPSSVHSPPSEYPQSVENSSQDPSSTGPSTNSTPRSRQGSFFNFFPPDYYSSSRSPSPSRSPSSFPFPSRTPSPSPRGQPAIESFRRREEREGQYSPDYADLFYSLSSARCARYFFSWNACMDEAIRNQQDHLLNCSHLSRAFRFCVRHY